MKTVQVIEIIWNKLWNIFIFEIMHSTVTVFKRFFPMRQSKN